MTSKIFQGISQPHGKFELIPVVQKSYPNIHLIKNFVNLDLDAIKLAADISLIQAYIKDPIITKIQLTEICYNLNLTCTEQYLISKSLTKEPIKKLASWKAWDSLIKVPVSIQEHYNLPLDMSHTDALKHAYSNLIESDLLNKQGIHPLQILNNKISDSQWELLTQSQKVTTLLHSIIWDTNFNPFT